MLYAIKSRKQIKVTDAAPPVEADNVRIVDPITEAHLRQIQTRIAALKRIHTTILNDKFPTFEIATDYLK